MGSVNIKIHFCFLCLILIDREANCSCAYGINLSIDIFVSYVWKILFRLDYIGTFVFITRFSQKAVVASAGATTLEKYNFWGRSGGCLVCPSQLLIDRIPRNSLYWHTDYTASYYDLRKITSFFRHVMNGCFVIVCTVGFHNIQI